MYIAYQSFCVILFIMKSNIERYAMTKQISNIIEQNWKQLKANIKENWDKLNDEDIAEIQGEYAHLISKLEEVYDITKSQAESAG